MLKLLYIIKMKIGECMENKNRNKKIAIYIAILIVLLGGSFIIYKIAKASINNAIISDVTMTSIETGTNFDSQDGLVITCDGNGVNCTNTYNASQDSSKDNILVKSFDKIKYNFSFNIKDSQDEYGDIENATVNLRVILNGEDSKYVSIDGTNCNNEGLCVIRNTSSYERTDYSVVLNVNNAPNGYEIHPTFSFEVEENPGDAPAVLGYNETSNTRYFYSYNNGSYSSVGPANYMPTVVSSMNNGLTYIVHPGVNSTQATSYNGLDGRFDTYIVGLRMNDPVAGSYYGSDDISFRVNFTQSGTGTPISNENWIRLYGLDIVDGINPTLDNLPYSTSSVGELSKHIRKPGNVSVTKDGNDFIVTISNYEALLDRPTLNADNSSVDGSYIATLAITSFSPRLEEDGQNIINNTMTIKTMDGTPISSGTIQNRPSEIGSSEQIDPSTGEITGVDVLTASAWYDETETTQLSLRNNGSGAVSKGTYIKYVTRFKNNKTSSNQGLKEVIKFDSYAYRVMPYDNIKDVSIKVKCGKTECQDISQDDFEISFVTGTFDYALGDKVQYELNDISNTKLSDNDKAIANQCASINLATLNKDQIQNLYGGPCIKATDGVETIYNNISDAHTDENSEIPISKVIIQTKDGVTLPDKAEVIVSVKARVRSVSDLTHNYQATTMISTSDYDSRLYYYAPQIGNAINPNNYIKTVYDGSDPIEYNGFIGDSLKIVNFTLRQNITVTNKNSDGSVKTKYRTVNNETITYKIETKLNDNEMNVSADDTWYIRSVYVDVYIPRALIYIPDDDLIKPISVTETNEYTHLKYLLITPNDKIKSNMNIKDIYFKTKLSPTLSGAPTEITVTSEPTGENINGEIDTTIRSGRSASFTIYGTGINEVIGTQAIGESGSLIEKNGTINYVLNAYNNVGDNVNDYTLIDIFPYNGDENGSKFNGNYKVKVTSDTVNLSSIKCTKEIPTRITANDETIWEDCINITNDYQDDITAIKISNININQDSYMGDIIVSIKTKDNKASDKYANRFKGWTRVSNENPSNVIEASVINRRISGHVFLDGTGAGIKDGNETYMKDIPITLYKVGNEGVLNQVAETTTNEDGYYEFSNLDKGRYKIRTKYDNSKYDLALRYATDDISKDSDAYLIDNNGTVEISDKSETSRGLVLYPPTNIINNMDVGLIPKSSFGFTMNKYITRIDLSNNGNVTTNNYNNLSTVSLSVINPNKYTTKVYYGISITNNSSKAGYVNLVKEDIPNGFIFDKNYPENAGWFEADGQLANSSLENTLINPGESVYLQIVLFLPARDEAGTFINTASIAEITEYNPVVPTESEYVNNNQYQIGDSLRFAGINFHVIGAVPNGSEQILTLLADSDSSKSHMTSDGVYKWSNSLINTYINNDWILDNNINASALIPFNICDDASGLFNENASGGKVDTPVCAGGIYTTSNVRLLTETEFNNLINNLTDTSFLLNEDFWLMDSVYATANDNTYDAYGDLNPAYDTSNLVKYVKASNSSVLPVQGTSGFNKDINVTSNLNVRPVIRISTHNIILE